MSYSTVIPLLNMGDITDYKHIDKIIDVFKTNINILQTIKNTISDESEIEVYEDDNNINLYIASNEEDMIKLQNLNVIDEYDDENDYCELSSESSEEEESDSSDEIEEESESSE